MTTKTVLPVTSSDPWFDFEASLSGALYGFEFRWNERSAAWFMTIRDANGVDLASGRRVVIGANLLGRSGSELLPPGALVAYDTELTDRDPGRLDLGGRVKLLYITEP